MEKQGGEFGPGPPVFFLSIQREEEKEGGGGKKCSRGGCSLSALYGDITFKLFVFKEGRGGHKYQHI